MKLQGFNNLTKSLRTNLYFIYPDEAMLSEALARSFHADALQLTLDTIAERIEAVVLHCSKQNYQPWGASALMLLSDAGLPAVQMHLNKSHLCAHTYPDADPRSGLCSLRLDLDLASCGTISPLRSLDFILDRFRPDAAVIDYTIRGFTRDADGNLLFQDHPLQGLQESLAPAWTDFYERFDCFSVCDQTWQLKLLARQGEASGLAQLRKIMQWTQPTAP